MNADAPSLTDDERAVLGALLTLSSQAGPQEHHSADLVIARAMVKPKVVNDLIERGYVQSSRHPKTQRVQVALAPTGLVLAYHCHQQRSY